MASPVARFFKNIFPPNWHRVRRSAIFGPTTHSQKLHRLKWAMIVAFPFVAYFKHRSNQVNAVEPPLLQAMKMQPIDYQGVQNWWQQWYAVLQPYWTNEELRKGLTFEQRTEIDFLRTLSWDAEQV